VGTVATSAAKTATIVWKTVEMRVATEVATLQQERLRAEATEQQRWVVATGQPEKVQAERLNLAPR